MSQRKHNPFKELDKTLQEAPEHLKGKVMTDVATVKLFMEMASLFTCNYKSAIEGMFKTNSKI